MSGVAYRICNYFALRHETEIRNRLILHGAVVVDGKPSWMPELVGGYYAVKKIHIPKDTEDEYFLNSFFDDLKALRSVQEIELNGIWWKGWMRDEFETHANSDEILKSNTLGEQGSQWIRSVRTIRPSLKLSAGYSLP